MLASENVVPEYAFSMIFSLYTHYKCIFAIRSSRSTFIKSWQLLYNRILHSVLGSQYKHTIFMKIFTFLRIEEPSQNLKYNVHWTTLLAVTDDGGLLVYIWENVWILLQYKHLHLFGWGKFYSLYAMCK